MTISTVSSQRTYALVVGIEKYNAGTSWNLNGPANDARKFAEWLCSRGVPRENIFLFLSPLDESSGALPAVQPATRDNLYRAITDTLRQKEGDLLYIFWGGHGIITREGSRKLFYADATQETKLNLDLNSLLTALRSDYFPNFSQQICIIDTCANHVEQLRLTHSLPDEFFPYGQPVRKTREQFVLLAAKPGERAKNITERKTGLFSEAVMEELEKDADSIWPPNMKNIAERLESRFKEWREEGSVRQTPTYLWYQDWDAHEVSLGRIEEVEPVSYKNILYSSDSFNAIDSKSESMLFTQPIEIFYSYYHEEEKMREKLEMHLSTLKREGVITNWHNRKILAGSNRKSEIDEHLNTARLILLLICPGFLDSDYCYNVEVNKAMQRHEAGKACVIPVLIRSVDWSGTPFSGLEPLPTGGKPVDQWANRNKAFLNIAQGIRKKVEELTTKLS